MALIRPLPVHAASSGPGATHSRLSFVFGRFQNVGPAPVSWLV